MMVVLLPQRPQSVVRLDSPDGLLLAAITLKRNRVEKLGCTMQLGNNVGNLNLRKI